jgi:predicted enzyme related to lactoylglutathione lyase
MAPWQIAGLQMIEQRIQVGDHVMTMFAPADVDAVIDYYAGLGGALTSPRAVTGGAGSLFRTPGRWRRMVQDPE